MPLLITDETMHKAFNNFLTGELESMTCSCETNLNPEASYELFRDWKWKDGAIRPLYLKGKYFIEGYRNYGSPTPNSWVVGKDADLIIRLFRKIKDI